MLGSARHGMSRSERGPLRRSPTIRRVSRLAFRGLPDLPSDALCKDGVLVVETNIVGAHIGDLPERVCHDDACAPKVCV